MKQKELLINRGLTHLLLLALVLLMPKGAWAGRYDTDGVPQVSEATGLYTWAVRVSKDGDGWEYEKSWAITPGEALSQDNPVFQVIDDQYQRGVELHGSATFELAGPYVGYEASYLRIVAISGLQHYQGKEQSISGTISVRVKSGEQTIATLTPDAEQTYMFAPDEPIVWTDDMTVEIAFDGCECYFDQLNVIDGYDDSETEFEWPRQACDEDGNPMSDMAVDTQANTLKYYGFKESFSYYYLLEPNISRTISYQSSDTDVATVDVEGKVTVTSTGTTTITATVMDGDEYFNATTVPYSYTLTVTADEAQKYPLWVGGTQVTEANRENVIGGYIMEGMASFDPETTTLTLENTYIEMGEKLPFAIVSEFSNLTVKLVSNNTVMLNSEASEEGTLCFIKYTGGQLPSSPTVTFETEWANGMYGSLDIMGLDSYEQITDGYTVTNTLREVLNHESTTGWFYEIVEGGVRLWYREYLGLIVKTANGDVYITDENRNNVLEEYGRAPSVQYDGHNRLVLSSADIQGVILTSTGLLPVDSKTGKPCLEIYLEGDNKIANSAGFAIYSELSEILTQLTFHTGSDKPGSLECTNSTPIDLDNVGPFQNFIPQYKDHLREEIGNYKVTIRMPLGLIIDVSSQQTSHDINYNNGNTSINNGTALNNVIHEDVLYTLNDEATAVSQDGYDETKECLVINSLMTDDGVDNIDTDVNCPGSDEFKELFHGITFIVPAGTGIIRMKIVTTPGFAFHVKVGNQPAVEVTNNVDPQTDITSSMFREVSVPYACSEASYVFIYVVQQSAGAPLLAWHRIGPKTHVSGGLGGMSVSSSMVSFSPDASLTYRVMGAGDWGRSGNHITVNATDVTDLADNAFGFAGSLAPAMGSERAGLSEHTTYIDASATQITGKSFSRTEGAFAGVPEETFIYLPAGNTAVGKNFVIGGVCQNMAPLESASEKDFEVAADFVAARAEYDRAFTQSTGSGECYSIFLPYALPLDDANVGEFFTYEGFDGTTVTLNKVVALSDNEGKTTPNEPYIFKPAKTGALDAVCCAAMKKLSDSYVEAAPGNEAEAEGLHGVYKYYKWETKPSNVYCYSATDKGSIKAGEFVKVGAGTHVKPFRAYLRIPGTSASAPESLTINWGDGTTSIIPLDKSQVQRDADGWYTITGFRLPAKPTEKGLYIHGNKKIVIK